jgi:hypothetical protein
MYEYEVTFEMSAGNRSKKIVINTIKQVRTNFWSEDLKDILEKQFGARPSRILSHKFLGKR